MDHTFDPQDIETRGEKSSTFSFPSGFKKILEWLAGMVILTKDEQENSGIYRGYQHD